MSSDFLSHKLVSVTSYDRQSGNTGDFTIDLSQQLPEDNNINATFDYVALINCAIPKSYYLIDSTNNQFTVTEGKTQTTLTIPSGNYSFATLEKTLTTLLASLTFTYAVDSDRVSGHFTFTVSNNLGVQPIFDFTNYNNPALIIGFEEIVYTFTADYLESVNIVNFQRVGAISIKCDFVDLNVLATVVPDATDFGLITYQTSAPSFNAVHVTTAKFNAARFYLENQTTEEAINLNGINWSMRFVLFKSNSYYNHMLEDSKMKLKI